MGVYNHGYILVMSQQKSWHLFYPEMIAEFVDGYYFPTTLKS